MYPILRRNLNFLLFRSCRKKTDLGELNSFSERNSVQVPKALDSVTNDLSEVQLDIVSERNSVQVPKALDIVTNDLSEVNPFLPSSFNLAAYVNGSQLLQNLVDLHVNLSKIEKKPWIAQKLLTLDYERNVKNHIWFIKDYVDDLGTFLTKNPMILFEQIEYLQVRINYLQSKLFTDIQIKRIVSRNPFWLMYSTPHIDRRLGFFQDTFSLCGEEVRTLTTKQPRLITYSLNHVKTNQFTIKEEMGFEDSEIKQLLLKEPKLWMLNKLNLLRRFNYIHSEMKIPHQVILKNSGVLMCRTHRLKQRHLFLSKLGRAQYNPKKENYVPIKALIEGSDSDFSINYAKCNVQDYNLFLKSL